MKFTLEIELGNDAMSTPDDVSHALAELSEKHRNDCKPWEDGDRGKIWDGNGNTVGSWQVSA